MLDRRTFTSALFSTSLARPLLGQEAAPAHSMNSRLFTFVGGNTGRWAVTLNKPYLGAPLAEVARIDIVPGAVEALQEGAAWMLRGVGSNERYTTRREKEELVAKQAPLGRPEATRGAIIPIRKNEAWWQLTQDERRAIFEETSKHLSIGLKYLPAISRKLHHCRDIGESEPFDFITLFDYAEAEAQAFEDLVGELRATEEWKYVDREVDLRMTLVPDAK